MGCSRLIGDREISRMTGRRLLLMAAGFWLCSLAGIGSRSVDLAGPIAAASEPATERNRFPSRSPGEAAGGSAVPQTDAQGGPKPEKNAANAADAALVLTVTGEIPPEMAPVAGTFVAVFYDSYPRLLKRFDHPERRAARKIELHFADKLPAPAFCAGDRISISLEWMRQHPDDFGLLTHELTHVVQHYPNSDPGWLTEGIADYARALYGPKVQPGWKLPERLSEKQSYRDSYRTTARFLQWLDQKRPGCVDKVHQRMQEGSFTLPDFEAYGGASVDELWSQCVKELAAPVP